MILFKPADEMQNSASYIAADDNNEVCGKCSFGFSGFEMRFTSVDCNDDMVKEGLARSAMNYCANRGAFISMIDADMLSPAFERLGFSKDNLTVEIPDALTSSCCSCK